MTNKSFAELCELSLNFASKLDIKQESRKSLIDALNRFPKEYFAYAFLGGSFSYGGGVPAISDIDVGVVFRNNAHLNKQTIKSSIKDFIVSYREFNQTNGFVPDYVFPGEYMTLDQIIDATNGRAFLINQEDETLLIPLLNNEDYLADYERWFQVWLTMPAFSTYLYGDIDLFVENKLNAWKTVILYILSRKTVRHVDVSSIMIEIRKESLEEFRIDHTYPLFEEKECDYCAKSMELLSGDGYLIKKELHYEIVPEKLRVWVQGIIRPRNQEILRKSEFLFGFDEMKEFGEHKI